MRVGIARSVGEAHNPPGFIDCSRGTHAAAEIANVLHPRVRTIDEGIHLYVTSEVRVPDDRTRTVDSSCQARAPSQRAKVHHPNPRAPKKSVGLAACNVGSANDLSAAIVCPSEATGAAQGT